MFEYYRIQLHKASGPFRWPRQPTQYQALGETNFETVVEASWLTRLAYPTVFPGTIHGDIVARSVHALSADGERWSLDQVMDADPIEQEVRKTPSQVHRGRELEWRRANRDVLQAFAGQWIVLEGENIIASGADPAQVIEDARARGVQVPYIFCVDVEDEDVVRFGL